MDRYSEEADPAKRQASRAKTTEIKNLRERVDALKNSGVSPSSSHTLSFFPFLTKFFCFPYLQKRPFTEAMATLVEDIFSSEEGFKSDLLDDDLKKDLDARRGEISMEILEAEVNIKTLKAEVEEIWDGDEALEYELASVFMHRGSSLALLFRLPLLPRVLTRSYTFYR